MRFYDQMDRAVEVPHWPPKRIVSLVPSQTELLYDLGLENEVVGITKFCVHPAHWFQTLPRVGGTKTVNVEKVQALTPDLIIGNKEENTRDDVERLQTLFPVWMSDIATLHHALDMIGRLGDLTNRSEPAAFIINRIEENFRRYSPPPSWQLLRAAYFIWRKPYMAVGTHTFIHDMLEKAGFINVFQHLRRYPEITASTLAEAAPDVIFLSSEPYPFAEKHFPEFAQLCPDARIAVVDGEMFSWYGSHLSKAAEYFADLRARLV